MINIFGFAPIVTQITPSNTSANTVFGGGIVKVWGFTINRLPTGAGVVATVRTNEASPTTIWMGTLSPDQSVVVNIPFIADKGLEVISASANLLSFTFWHSQVGT